MHFVSILPLSCMRQGIGERGCVASSFVLALQTGAESWYTQRNLFKSNRNQIVFTMHLDSVGTANGHCPFAVPNQSRCMVNTI